MVQFKFIWNIWNCCVFNVWLLFDYINICINIWMAITIINTKMVQNAEAKTPSRSRERKWQEWLCELWTSEYTTTEQEKCTPKKEIFQSEKQINNNLFQFTVRMWINYVVLFCVVIFFFIPTLNSHFSFFYISSFVTVYNCLLFCLLPCLLSWVKPCPFRHFICNLMVCLLLGKYCKCNWKKSTQFKIRVKCMKKIK